MIHRGDPKVDVWTDFIRQYEPEKHHHKLTYRLLHQPAKRRLVLENRASHAGLVSIEIEVDDLFEVLRDLGYKDAKLGGNVEDAVGGKFREGPREIE